MRFCWKCHCPKYQHCSRVSISVLARGVRLSNHSCNREYSLRGRRKKLQEWPQNFPDYRECALPHNWLWCFRNGRWKCWTWPWECLSLSFSIPFEHGQEAVAVAARTTKKVLFDVAEVLQTSWRKAMRHASNNLSPSFSMAARVFR